MLLRVGDDVRAHEAIGRRGGGAVRGFDECSPRFELEGGVAAGGREEFAVGSDEFIELRRHLLGQGGLQGGVNRRGGLREQLRGQLRLEGVVRGSHETGPEPELRVGGNEARL